MKIIGIDPGTIITGYASIFANPQSIQTVDLGVIKPPKEELLSTRYTIIFESIEELIDRFNPDCFAIETPFVYKNPQTAIKLGGALSAILVAATAKGKPVYGYTPTEVRKGILGIGSSCKLAIRNYLIRALKLEERALTKFDATDALAVAVHHAQEERKSHPDIAQRKRL